MDLGSARSAAIATAVASVSAVTFVLAAPGRYVLAASAAVAAGFLLMQPLRRWPAIALALFALVPVSYLPGADMTSNLSPGILVMIAWGVGVAFSADFRLPAPAIYAPVALSAGWILWLNGDSVDPQRSWFWTFSFFAGFLWVALVARSAPPGTMESLRRTWLWLGIALGAFAIVEFLLQGNPLYGDAYSKSFTQHWSVYRATTTLGHPLAGATFFAVTFAIAFGLWVRGGEGRRLAAGAALFSFVGGVLTGSRSALLAMGVAGGVVIALMIAGRSDVARGRRGVLLVGLSGGLVAGYFSPLIQQRTSSTEGVRSALDREAASAAAHYLANIHDWLGAGPGASLSAARLSLRHAPILESAYYQLIVSVGVPGLIFITWLIAALLWATLRQRRFDATGGLVALVVMAMGFNYLESYRPGLILLGLGALLALGERDREGPPGAPDAGGGLRGVPDGQLPVVDDAGGSVDPGIPVRGGLQ